MLVEETGVQMQLRQTLRYLLDMVSAIKAPVATRQSEIGSLPYRLYYVTARGESRLQIHASCRKLIESMELQSSTEKGEPDKESGYDHMADALGYLIWREFNPLFARSGKATGIRIY